MALIKSLTSIRTLESQISGDIGKKLWDHSRDRFIRLATCTEGLRKMSILPLQNVEVTVRVRWQDHPDCNGRRPFDGRLWQQGDMEQCPADLKVQLLNPKDAEVYVQTKPTSASKTIRYTEEGRTFDDFIYIA